MRTLGAIIRFRSAVGVLPAVLLVLASTDSSAQSGGQLLLGVTPSNRLIAFSSANPAQLLHSVPITNLAPGEVILGIDVRPANNQLYALGSTSQLYVINYLNGVATRVGAPFIPALSGTDFGFDFNPTVDRIRIVSNTGQNLRLHPDTGAVAAIDGALSYAPGDPNAGRTPQVTAAAYTNPDNDPATGTLLVDIDAALDLAVSQNPPNDGRLNALLPLGVDLARAGFDISLTDAFVAYQTTGGASSTLLRFKGAQPTTAGTIGGGEPVPNLAVFFGLPSTPPAERVFAVTANNELIGFDAGRATNILSRVPIAPLSTGERIVGIDFRPATNALYGLGSNSQLYILDPRTGAATRVGPPLSTTLSGNEFGFDFNPAVDRLRVVSDTGQNLRLHPDTGAVVAVDSTLAYASTDANAGQTPRVGGAAYTNPDNNPATGTTLFVIDTGLDVGASQDPPNAGVLNTVLPLGGNAGDVLGFDISMRQILVAVAGGPSAQTLLFDLANRRSLGSIGNGETVCALAISLGQ
jgi:Domain of unknown function (DUF4394)